MRIGVLLPTIPRPDMHGGDNRIVHLMALMTTLGHEVTLLIHESVSTPIESPWPTIPTSPEDIAPLSRLVHFEILWISFYDLALLYMHQIRAVQLADRIIVDTVDAHSLRETRAAMLCGSEAKRRRARLTRIREQDAYDRADAIVAVSEPDAAYIAHQVINRPVFIVGNVHRIGNVAPLPPAGRNDLAFVGGYGHAPNIDAVLYFIQSILPRILSSVPRARFLVIGSRAEIITNLPQSERILLIGHVGVVERYLYRCHALVAPLRFGAGIKGKICQAMAIGLPVVTTSIGAEGLGVRDGQHLLVRDDASTFADAVERLCFDEILWRRLSRTSIAHVDECFRPAVAKSQLHHVLGWAAT
jgi:O-antigen biosynthesis protein